MNSNSTHYVPQGGYNEKRRMQRGSQQTTGPIINWAALWSRIWLFTKRLIAEIWFLLSRRKEGQTGILFKDDIRSKHPIMPYVRRWSIPLFKVTAVLFLFFYVMQRDIQFSIAMKAPLGQLANGQAATTPKADEMGFVQSVSFSGSATKSKERTPKIDVIMVEDYMQRFASIARTEMDKYGIPASIKMAQAIFESQAGQSVAAKVDNNHFGQRMAGQPYESAWRNWREHSLMVVNQFSELRKNGTDYRAWARGLEKSGYHKHPNYANELLEIIDRFHLEQLDDSTI